MKENINSPLKDQHHGQHHLLADADGFMSSLDGVFLDEYIHAYINHKTSVVYKKQQQHIYPLETFTISDC